MRLEVRDLQSSARLVLESLPQTFSPVVPSLVVIRTSKLETNNDERCNRKDGDKQSHLRSPLFLSRREG
jgi:hypothetical protein